MGLIQRELTTAQDTFWSSSRSAASIATSTMRPTAKITASDPLRSSSQRPIGSGSTGSWGVDGTGPFG